MGKRRNGNGKWMNKRLASLLTLALVACGAPENSVPRQESQESMSYFILLEGEEKDQFLEKASSLQLNQEWKVVEGILGPPDVEAERIPKKTEQTTGTLRRYYVKKLSEELVNEKLDQSLDLEFSSEGILIGISSSIEGFPVKKGDVP